VFGLVTPLAVTMAALQFGLRLRAVKNSMKRRLVRSPQARIMASSAPRSRHGPAPAAA
jgi:hypothetical protein